MQWNVTVIVVGMRVWPKEKDENFILILEEIDVGACVPEIAGREMQDIGLERTNKEKDAFQYIK